MQNKNIIALLVTLFVFLLFVVGCGQSGSPAGTGEPSYNYITPEQLKARLDAGDHDSGTMILVTTQTEEEYATGHLQEAYPTYARPLETDEDFAKLDPFLNMVKNTDQDIIILCPRGGSGATRPFDYFKERGIDTDRMLILQGGQEAYNEAFPDEISY